MEQVPSCEQFWDAEETSNENRDLHSESDESEWGTINNLRIEDILGDDSFVAGEEKQLYIPEPVILIANIDKPELPRLCVESVPIGCKVWVVDEEDVRLLLREYWDDCYRAVCNGRLCGSVVRHCHALTLVLFYDAELEMKFSLSLPRACLSLSPVESYRRSPCGSSRLLASHLGLGNLDLCAGRAGEDAATSRLHRQFYESLSVMEIQAPRLGPVQACFFSGAYEEALALLSELPAEASQRIDALTLRSRVNAVLGRWEEALKDAQEVIKLEPFWVRGYLAISRALSGLGKFDVAAANIHRAMFLLPHSKELCKIQKLNSYMYNLQRKLPCNDLSLFLDFWYAKKLVTRRPFRKLEVVYKEDQMILAMESMFSTCSDRCCVCLKPHGEMMCVPEESVGGNSEESAYYCGVDCHKHSSLFFPMEFGRHRAAVERARDLIFCNSKQTISQTPFDMACMVIRLFLMICVTHNRLSLRHRCPRRAKDGSPSNFSGEQKDPGNDVDLNGTLPLHVALRHLGVYPLVTEQPNARVHGMMSVVYNVLTACFSDDERNIYSLTLFCALYEYVRTFAVVVDAKHTKSRLYYLPQFMGAVERVAPSEANCEVVMDQNETNIALVASKNISAGEVLSIPAWDSYALE